MTTSNIENAEWILQYRTDSLTEFFLIMPFFASDVFYLTAISFGYWFKPAGKTFTHLGFLIPFSTILNLILKNAFGIMRPPLHLFLVEVREPLGFPSGDVQVAAIFWGMIFLRTNLKYLRFISIAVIILIMISRVYLGVHSISDVVGGAFIGAMLLTLWQNNQVQIIVSEWFNGKRLSYWLLVVSCLVVYYVTTESFYSPMFIASCGALIGYGLSLDRIGRWQPTNLMYTPSHFFNIVLSFILLLILYMVIPIIEYNELTKTISGIMKYALLSFMIYSVFPQLQTVKFL